MTDTRPRTKMEDFVASVWCKALELDQIELDDTFVDLGGDSMDALQVISEIEKELGVKLNHEKHFVSSLAQVALELTEETGGE